MIKKHLLGSFLILVVLLSSCTAYKDKIYFQGVNRSVDAESKIVSIPATTIQVGDILVLNVKSLNADGSAIFNTDAEKSASAYLVNSSGEIQLPLAHNVKVAGYTFVDAAARIKAAIGPFLKEPEISVSLVNFRIAVLGDVAHPDNIS